MQWIVQTSYSSNYPNPIYFQVGEFVEIGVLDDEFHGWIWVTTVDGNQGWAPVQYLDLNNDGNTAIVLNEYSARELNTTIGESLVLHYELNGWGWVENEKKEFGWVPMSTIKRGVSEG